MALATRTFIEIVDVPLSNTYAHTLWFENVNEQKAYFESRMIRQFAEYAYIRRTWSIKVTAQMEDARKWRYLRFCYVDEKNTLIGGKWYYYFINRVDYINDSTVELQLEMDLLQTYLFDWNLNECFIERQHTPTDEVGEHTVDEGLELGELINVHSYNVEGMQEMAIVIVSAVHLSDKVTSAPVDPAPPVLYDNVFSGLGVYAVATDDWMGLAELLERYNGLGVIDGIVGMYMYPKNLLTLKSTSAWGEGDIVKEVVGADFDFSGLALYTNYDEKLFGGYTPRNKKLYVYPFNFLYLTNNAGGCAEYRYERFTDVGSEYTFTVYGGISQDAGIRINPAYYNGSDGYEYGLTLGNYPSCAWNSDVYKVWLAQNYNSLNHQATGAVIQAAGGAITAGAALATGNLLAAGAGAVTAYNSVNAIAGMLAQKRDMSIQPAQARGSQSVTCNTNALKQTFTFYYKTVDREHAQIIDDFFTVYGYRINRVQRPNIHARSIYTYVKTVGCCPTGDMNSDELRTIGNIFDNGVTFWTVGKVYDGDRVVGYYDHIGNYQYNPLL